MKSSLQSAGAGASSASRGNGGGLTRKIRWPFVSGTLALLLLLCQSVNPGNIEAQSFSVIEGTIEAYYQDSVNGPQLIHELNTGKRRHRLQYGKNKRIPEFITGDRVRARGTLSGQSQVMMLGGGGTGDSGVTTIALASPYTFGPQQTLVILINFTQNTSQPHTASTAESVTFTDVDNFYDETSFQQTSLNGTVVGWYTINPTGMSYSTCNYNDWAMKADAAAFNAGVDVLSFPRKIYSFPHNPACGWWGLGTIGGGSTALPSKAWINGEYSLRVVAHEMGHNYGAYHSRSRECETAGCTVVEYGDDHDIMANVTGHFNAFQKERFGWLNYGTSPPIQTVTDTTQVALESYSAPYSGLPKALKILKSGDGTSNTYIYAEARTATGFDSALNPGVVVHTGIDNNGAEGYEIDLDPTSAAEDFILSPGQSFTFSDVEPRITLTTLSSDNAGAVVAVVTSASSCGWSLAAPSQNFVHGGGAGSVALTTQADCGWIATSLASWIAVDAGSTNGTQSSTVHFTVAANNTTSPRSGTLTIGGQTFTVTQNAAPCTPTVSPLNPKFNHNGGTGTLTVTAPIGCAWTASETAPWISNLSPTSGDGAGSVTFTVAGQPTSTASRNANMAVAGSTVNVYQEGKAALFTSPLNAAIGVSAPSHVFTWSSPGGALAYELTIGTTYGGNDLVSTGEITQLSRSVTNLPASKMLYARVRTKFAGPIWTMNEIWFTTVDRVAGVQVLGAQSPAPLPAGASAQYGSSAATSVKVSFTGSGGTCTATLSVTGLPAGATATFDPPSLPASAAEAFSLLTIGTTGATPSGTHTMTIRAQEDAACGSGLVTTTTNLETSIPASAVAPVAVSSPYGSTTTLSATLTSNGVPIAGKTLSFSVNGTAAGSATTDGSGVASLSNVSLTGINAGAYATGIQASFAGDATHSASSGSSSLTVTPRSVTATVVAADKEYNGSSVATVSSCTVSPVVGEDAVACTSTAASFSSPAAGPGKPVTVVSLSLTGAAAGNYVLSSTTATTTATITPKAVSPTAAVLTKAYDGSPSASLSSCSVGPLPPGSRDVVLCNGSASFDTPAAGVGKTVTVTGLTLTGANAANYALTTTTTTTTGTITAKSVTPSVTAANKAYDGLTQATLSGCALSGTLGGDVVSCTGAATFDTAAVGAGKTVTANGLTLTGPAAGNYVLSAATATTTASITTSTLTAVVTAATKVYDGNTSATVTNCTLSGAVSGDAVGCTTNTATFDSAAVGAGKTVTVNGLALTGAAAGNYALASSTATTTAAITTRTTTATVAAANKPYNGMAGATLTSCTLSGVVGADVVGCTGSASFDSAAVGAGKTVTATGLTLNGAAAGNYVLSSTTATTTAAISAVTVTPTVAAANKPYDGLTGATLTSCTLSGVIGGDVVGCTGSASFGSAAVGAGKTVTVSGLALTGPAANNYALASTTATTTAAITAGTVTPAVTVASRQYNGTAVATVTGCTVSGQITGDVVACTTGAATFDTAAAGTGKTVTVNDIALAGPAAGNYSLSSSSTTTAAAITARGTTASIVVANKAYDGSAAASIAGCTLSGVVAGDIVGCTGSATFDNAHTGSGKTVTAQGLTITGIAAGNYTLSSTTATTTGTITPRPVLLTASAANKVYDGTTGATLASCTISGAESGDVVGCTGTATFGSASVGAGKPVTVSNLALSGAGAGNYSLSMTTTTTTANITALAVTPSVAVANKPYDGQTGATLTTCTLAGVVAGDVVGCTGTATFDSAAVGTAKTVTANGLTLTGAAAANYTLTSSTATTTGAITTLIVTPAPNVGNKSYDGTRDGTLTGCTVNGVIGGDAVSCTGTATFDTPDAGSMKTVKVTSLALTGPAAGNYVLQPAGGEAQALQEWTTTADIQPLTITAGVTVADKIYDGTTAATLAACTPAGVVASDVVTCTGAAAFATPGVGVGKAATVTGLALDGPDAGNYVLDSTTASTTATIQQRTATPVVAVASKPFDGTTTATITSCTLAGVVSGDVVSCTGAAAFQSAGVGTARTVTVTGLALTGTAAANYSLSETTTTATADITQPNRAPVVTNPGAQSAFTGVAASLALTASDADGDTLTWSAVNAPTGMTINPSTGAFSGTPTSAGVFAVVVSASDGALAGQAAFTWSIAAPVPPAAAVPMSPAGTTTTTTPAFTWSAVPLAAYYAVQITDASAASQDLMWYTPAQANCASGTGTCTAAAPRTLQPGLVTWKLITWNSFGYGPWSASQKVVIDLSDATIPAPVAVGPVGSITTRMPQYTWNGVAGAAWYQLSVTDVFGVVEEYWYLPSQACGPTSCAATPAVSIAAGSANWHVRAWRATGAGAWSTTRFFDAAEIAPGKVTLIAPAGSVNTATPTFTWNAQLNASYYLVRLTDRDNSNVDLWYRPWDVGCGAGTGVCSTTVLSGMKPGAARWEAVAWNSSGYGPWSDARDFVVDIADPTALTPSPVTPAGTITSVPITYRWSAVTGALSYRLAIRNNGGAPTYWWLTAAQAGCQAGANCSGAPAANLLNGTGEWQVQAWTANGHGAWSAALAMTINVAAPLAPAPISPNGPTGTKFPQLRWNASANASLYYVTVYDVTGLRVDTWLTPAQANCPTGGVCTLNVGVALTTGTGSWRVLAWNSIDYSPWSPTATMVIP